MPAALNRRARKHQDLLPVVSIRSSRHSGRQPSRLMYAAYIADMINCVVHSLHGRRQISRACARNLKTAQYYPILFRLFLFAGLGGGKQCLRIDGDFSRYFSQAIREQAAARIIASGYIIRAASAAAEAMLIDRVQYQLRYCCFIHHRAALPAA